MHERSERILYKIGEKQETQKLNSGSEYLLEKGEAGYDFRR